MAIRARGGIGRIEGMRGCLDALSDLSKGVQRGVGKRSLTRGGNVLASRLSAAMPVSADPHNPTPGSLKAAPRSAPAKSERGSPRVALLVEDPAAVPGEFGTSKMKPHLTVRATVDSSRAEAGAAIADGLVEEVDAAVRRAARRAS